MKFAIAKKLNMTQLFTEEGLRVPVTVLEVEPAKVSLVRSQDKDGYEAVQLDAGKRRREFRGEAGETVVGQEVGASVFEPGDMVNLKGTSKGRGFAGVMKRHGFHGFPASHGHPHQRKPGSIGQAFPQHVRKGVRMAGQMGAVNVTETGLQIMAVDTEKNLLFVKGSVPGSFGGLIKIVATGKKKEAPKLMEFVEEEPVKGEQAESKPEPEQQAAEKQESQEEGGDEKQSEEKGEAEAKESEGSTGAPDKPEQEEAKPEEPEAKDDDKKTEQEEQKEG